jgi:hypothetical protein
VADSGYTPYVDNNTFLPVSIKNAYNESARNQELNKPIDSFSEYQYATDRLSQFLANKSNPPFKLSATNNRLVSDQSALGGTAGLLRGYIRRSDITGSDPTSSNRLYFMYNPETIKRSYIAYLDQLSLDPGNSMFGSNNMAAAPGILDFSFNLMFDRQIEVNNDRSHPGTKVDYDYFDLVVRGVVPDANPSGTGIPDNGIMMFNPRNITVVFGPELTVQGRPYNASMRFEKFDHRMTPTRMTISLTLKAFYIGPVSSSSVSAQAEQSNVAATINYENSITYSTSTVIVENKRIDDEPELSISSPSGTTTTIPTSGTTTSPITDGGTTGSGSWAVPPQDGSRPPGIPVGPYPTKYTRDSQQGNASGISSRTRASEGIEPRRISGEQIMEMLRYQEVPVENAIKLWAICYTESGFMANNGGYNQNGSKDVGLWQINNVNWGYVPENWICDPWINCKLAVALAQSGNRLAPWNRPIPPSNSANYRDEDGSWMIGRAAALEAAKTLFRQHGYIQ